MGGLIGTLMSAGALPMLLSVVLTGSIVLHSYATLQLRKSMLNPEMPLSSQTSGGLRIVGFVALFFAIIYPSFLRKMAAATFRCFAGQ